MTTTLHQDQPAPQESIGIDPGLYEVTTMAPVASKGDSHSLIILKYHHPIKLEFTAQKTPSQYLANYQYSCSIILQIVMKWVVQQ